MSTKNRKSGSTLWQLRPSYNSKKITSEVHKKINSLDMILWAEQTLCGKKYYQGVDHLENEQCLSAENFAILALLK